MGKAIFDWRRKLIFIEGVDIVDFSSMFHIKDYKYWLRKQLTLKIILIVSISLIILTAYYIVDGFSTTVSEFSTTTTQTSSQSGTEEDSTEQNNDEGSSEISHTQYENMIYKGGTLPLPFPEDYAILTSPFNPNRKHPISKVIRPHKGADIVGKRGTQILAVADGKVTVSSFDKGGYGNWVEIEHNINGKVIRTRYGHMRDTPLVKVGDIVIAGTVIGIQGQTGGATGEHLHFEVRIDGEAVNPLPYLIGKDTIETYKQW